MKRDLWLKKSGSMKARMSRGGFAGYGERVKVRRVRVRRVKVRAEYIHGCRAHAGCTGT